MYRECARDESPRAAELSLLACRASSPKNRNAAKRAAQPSNTRHALPIQLSYCMYSENFAQTQAQRVRHKNTREIPLLSSLLLSCNLTVCVSVCSKCWRARAYKTHTPREIFAAKKPPPGKKAA